MSGTGERWYLLNATPDVHRQIESDRCLHPGPGPRETPLSGVLLTDAEFDHTIGLLLLREGSKLAVYGTDVVLEALSARFPVRDLVRDYADWSWHEIQPGKPLRLDERLSVTAFAADAKPPRYVTQPRSSDSWVTGFRLEDTHSGGVMVYAPAVSAWDESLIEQLDGADCLFVDGTFWTDDEMVKAGVGSRTGAQMGHLPISGPDGTAARLAELAGTRRIYIHINNTNPILEEGSAERRKLSELGIDVGRVGLEIEL